VQKVRTHREIQAALQTTCMLPIICQTTKYPPSRVDKKSQDALTNRMDYTRQFRHLRETKNLSRDQLASLAGCHRNTVINVETGRPVKFSTIAELLMEMGYAKDSPETKGMALLWLEAVSGLKFMPADAQKTAEYLRSHYRRTVRAKEEELLASIQDHRLSRDQIELLAFASRHPAVLEILRAVRDFSEIQGLASAAARETSERMLKAAEE
jgi:transcriptional regulator with XRE-family HTH domain